MRHVEFFTLVHFFGAYVDECVPMNPFIELKYRTDLLDDLIDASHQIWNDADESFWLEDANIDLIINAVKDYQTRKYAPF